MQVLAGTLLCPHSSRECRVQPDGVVRIDAAGRIAEVGTDRRTGDAVLGGAGCWVLPGFIDAHLHVPQWDRRGLDGLSLFDWLDQVVYPAELRFQDPAFAERLAEDFVSGMLAHGTTTVAAYGSPFAAAVDRVFEVFSRRGLRAVYGQMLNDAQCPPALCTPADQALDQSRELAARWHGAADGRLLYAFNPRMPVFCSEKLMRGAAALAKMLNCHVQTHVAESRAEAAAVRERFPDQLDEIDLLAEVGLLTSRTLLGHGVFVRQDERRQLAEAGTAVVHCPTANLFLESGLMDYAAHRDAGVRLALGSGIAGGFDPFMPRVAVACLQTARGVRLHSLPRSAHPAPTAAEAWWLLTRGGAEALGLGARIGALEPGLEADLLVVRPEPWVADLAPEKRPAALLYTLRPSQIEHVFVSGRRVGP